MRLWPALAAATLILGICAGCAAGQGQSAESCAGASGYAVATPPPVYLDATGGEVVHGAPTLAGAVAVTRDGTLLNVWDRGSGPLWQERSFRVRRVPLALRRMLIQGTPVSVSGCAVGGRLSAITARPVRGSTALRLTELAEGVDLISPQTVEPGRDLLALLRSGSEAASLNARGLADEGAVWGLARPGTNTWVPLALQAAWTSRGESIDLFRVPPGAAPGNYEAFLSLPATDGGERTATGILVSVR